MDAYLLILITKRKEFEQKLAHAQELEKRLDADIDEINSLLSSKMNSDSKKECEDVYRRFTEQKGILKKFIAYLVNIPQIIDYAFDDYYKKYGFIEKNLRSEAEKIASNEQIIRHKKEAGELQINTIEDAIAAVIKCPEIYFDFSKPLQEELVYFCHPTSIRTFTPGFCEHGKPVIICYNPANFVLTEFNGKQYFKPVVVPDNFDEDKYVTWQDWMNTTMPEEKILKNGEFGKDLESLAFLDRRILINFANSYKPMTR